MCDTSPRIAAPLAGALSLVAACFSGASASELLERYIEVPLPAHFSVRASEIEGPVFADANGRTLYRWPVKSLSAGITGDAEDQTNCTDVKTTVNSGYMSPYPGGLLLPDLDTRPSCEQAWPPALAPANAKPIGKWTLIKRKDGSRQWAYEGFALYTSVLDHRPGDVLGINLTYRYYAVDTPAVREPIKPPPEVPSGFAVASVQVGRLLVDAKGFSIYSTDRDEPDKSHCYAECARTWLPMPAPASAEAHGAWSIVERSPGVRQWAYRKKPLYRYALDSYVNVHSLQGADEPGWHNVLMQAAPAPPAEFTVQNTTAGQVLADAHGKTIYIYTCVDDAVDQLGCDHPTETQVYRLAMCGAGDAQRCLRTFPYVLAATGATSRNRSWSVLDIDPTTGRVGEPGAPGVLHVWAYRGRPVYTYSGDAAPGDINGEGRGELQGERNGFNAFWLRDDFLKRAG